MFPPFPVRLSKLDWVFQTERFQYPFATVSIPAEAFQGTADLRSITAVAFRLEGGGHIRLDNIGLAG